MLRLLRLHSPILLTLLFIWLQGGASAADPLIISDDEEEEPLQGDVPLITPLAMVPPGKVFTPDFESVGFLTELLENMVKQAYLISEQGWAPFSGFQDSFFEVMRLLKRINRSWAYHCAEKIYFFSGTVETLEKLQNADLKPEIEEAFQALRSGAGAATATAEELREKAEAEVCAKYSTSISKAKAHLASFSL